MQVGGSPIHLDKVKLAGGGEVVGAVPKGLPSFGLPSLDWTTVANIFPYAAIISLLGFMEAISIAKAMAARQSRSSTPTRS